MIKVPLDYKRYSIKPDEPEIIIIGDRIAPQVAEISIEDLAEQLTQPYGRSFCPSVFSGQRRKGDNWIQQQVFAIDIDYGISLADVIDRCERFWVKPAFMYNTFSDHGSNIRFRVVFVASEAITDKRIRKIIQEALMVIFPEADKQCTDEARLFLGGQSIIYQDYKARIDAASLIESMWIYLHTTDKNGNAARQVKTFCRNTGIRCINGVPMFALQGVVTDKMLHTEIDENGGHPIVINNSMSHETVSSLYFDDELPQGENALRANHKLIEKFSWDDLEQSCQLYRGFIDGSEWLYHGELFGLSTCLINIKGGQSKFIEGIASRAEYDMEKWKVYLRYNVKACYRPQNCTNFCPYCNTCEHGMNPIDTARLPRGEIRVLTPIQFKTLQQSEADLSKALQTALNAPAGKVTVIKGNTGLGKTQLFLDIKNAVIAVPTHKLKDEVAARMSAAGNSVVCTPEIPQVSDKIDKHIQHLYDVGANKAARAFVRSVAKESQLTELLNYLDELDTALESKKTIVTTHQRALSIDNRSLVIFDEDRYKCCSPRGKLTFQVY